MKKQKKQIVISAVNLFSGGPLTILKECLCFLDNASDIQASYSILALVHDENLFPNINNIQFLSLPKPRNSWLYKIYFEYVYFKKISKQYDVYLWLSLHDMTPSVKAKRRAVYCHNPAPFYKPNRREKSLDNGFYLFSLFYKYLYAINIRKNEFIIVQQQWIRERFEAMFAISHKKIIVAYPEITNTPNDNPIISDTNKIKFFYPAAARIFKNFEVLINAVPLIKLRTNIPFEIILTIGSNESAKNKYEEYLEKKSKGISEINFIGWQPYYVVQALYQNCACLLFPSKLETWGLPITEAKMKGLPMFVADLPYAKETVGDYDKVSFFASGNAKALADLMINFLENQVQFTGNKSFKPAEPFSQSWAQTFNLLLH